MNRTRVSKRIEKLIAELSGYVLKREPGITAEEERIAIMAACGGFAIRIGQDMSEDARRMAHNLARIVAEQIGPTSKTTDFVAPPMASKIEL